MDHAEPTVATPAKADGAMFRFSLAMAFNRISIPAAIVAVRNYDGETEEEAARRLGEAANSQNGIVFVRFE